MSARRRSLLAAAGLLPLLLAGCAADTPAPVATATPAVTQMIPFLDTDQGPLKLDACLPEGVAGAPVVVLVHGGSFQTGDADDLLDLCQLMAGQGMAAFSVDYTRIPTASFPTQAQQVAAAIDWVDDQAAAGAYDIDPDRLAIVGASAGAILTAELAYGAVDGTPVPAALKGIALLSGAYEFSPELASSTADGEQTLLQYVGCAELAGCDDRLAAASSLRTVTADAPPTLILHSTDELIPLDQANALDAKLTKLGVEHRLLVETGSDHAEFIVRNHPDARDALLEFLRGVLD